MNIFTSTDIFKFLISFSLLVVIKCDDESYEVQYDNICNGGQNVWTVGYGNRSLQATVHCNDDCNKLTNQVSWCLYNGTNNNAKCKAFAFVTGPPENETAPSANWTDSHSTSLLISKLNFFDFVKSSQQRLYALTTVSGTVLGTSRITISVEYCPERNERNVFIKDSSNVAISSRTYGTRGYFSCPTNEHLVNIAERNLATDNSTTCITCAQWEGMDEMDCWKAPKVSVKLTDDGSYIAGHVLNASQICNVTDRGKPKANPYLFWSTGNSNEETTATLQAKHNNKTIYCSMKNELTDLLENGSMLSDPLQLSIQFGPTELSNQTSCARFEDGSNLYNATLELFFSANPIGTAKFLDKNREPKNFTATNETAGCCGVPVQRYRIDLTNISADYSITFNYRQEGPNETTLQFEDLTKSCRSTGMTTAFIGLIVGIAVGGVILIILIIIMIVLIIRRRRKGDISDPPAGSSNIQEERTNPVYGTTELNSSGESKEVVENVLYGTRDATNSPADEYAEVVPKGKRKKTKTEPKDNGEAAASAEATYAVVDKKNKGKSGSDNAGYSGDPQPEETYAVVNKKGKKT